MRFILISIFTFIISLFQAYSEESKLTKVKDYVSYENLIKSLPANIIIPQKRKQFNLASSANEGNYSNLQVSEILNNVFSSWHKADYMLAEADILSFDKEDNQNKIFSNSIRIERHQGLVNSIRQTRELVTALTPEKIAPSHYLTIRAEKNSIYEYFGYASKLSNIYLKMDSILRDEGFSFNNSVSLNDFFSFSKRSNDVNVQTEERIIADILFFEEKNEADKTAQSLQIEKSKIKKNIKKCENFKFNISVDHLPLAPKIASRDVLKLTLLSNSTFSTIGKIILYLDENTLVPIYQEVYDRSDKIIKQVLNLFKIQRSLSGYEDYMLPILTLVVNKREDNNYSLIKVNEFLFCSADLAITPFKELDPSYLTNFK